MTIPYRVRRMLRRFFITLGVLSLVAILAMGAWMLWLSRYVVYTDDGVKFDFNNPFHPTNGMIAQPPTTGETVPIIYENAEDALTHPAGQLVQLQGYTITEEMLTKKFSDVQSAIEKLPSGSAVLLDVKNVRGEYFYSSSLGNTAKNVDATAFSQLIRDLQQKNCYLIARFPAFREFDYIIADQRSRVPYGLPKASGNGSLWEDKSIPNKMHYWLNPASVGTQDFIIQIVAELRTLGFHEVLLGDFRFPNTDKIKFKGDKAIALSDAAKVLSQACAAEGFALSFAGSQTALPEGRCRLYLENVSAEQLPELVSSLGLENPAVQLVFLTELMDTRFNAYSVLRPLDTL